ncbi:helix-hairpin-helix domain-containing protein [Anatilimnocola sp. NA78]|uniref:helix-hairpin-helix domain-containing protein n=1 Tax=Anatilimnocola sp. NA78 TaxID=3415683 RepID=UPI003CE54641
MNVLDIPVKFGGVSIGEATARLGLSIDRSVCNINAADETFCGHRLSGRVIRGRSGDQAGQSTIVEDLDHYVDAVFDVKRIGVNSTNITTGLTFSLADVDIRELAKLSKGAGRLIIKEVAELPDDAVDDAPQLDDETPDTLKAEGPWRMVQLSTLFEGALLKSLKEAGLTTVGQLSDYTASEKRLTDIPGIGPGKAEKIENRMLEFWEQNPNADQAEGAAEQTAEPAADQ